jgi:hypothetical protein
LHENEVHFASQHAVRLKIADLLQQKITEVYPVNIDLLHAEYESRLKSHMPMRKWCMDSNSMCDPSGFDCDLDGPVAVSQDLNTFAFVVVFDPAALDPTPSVKSLESGSPTSTAGKTGCGAYAGKARWVLVSRRNNSLVGYSLAIREKLAKVRYGRQRPGV